LLQRRTTRVATASYYSDARTSLLQRRTTRVTTATHGELATLVVEYFSGRRVLQSRRVTTATYDELLQWYSIVELLQQRRVTTVLVQVAYCTNSVAHVRLVEHYYSSGALVTNIQQTSIWYWCRRVTTVVVASLQWRRCWCIISLFAWFHCEFRFWQVSITNIIIFKLVCAYP